MYLGGYWGAPETCWIRQRASKVLLGKRLGQSGTGKGENKSDRGTGGKERRERWWLTGTKCCVPGSVLCTLYVLTNSIL